MTNKNTMPVRIKGLLLEHVFAVLEPDLLPCEAKSMIGKYLHHNCSRNAFYSFLRINPEVSTFWHEVEVWLLECIARQEFDRPLSSPFAHDELYEESSDD